MATTSSEGSYDEEPVVKPIRPSEFLKSLDSQVQRQRVCEARVQERKCFCLCCGAFVALMVALLVYFAFSILSYTEPNLDTVLIVVPTRPVPNTTDGPEMWSNTVTEQVSMAELEPESFTDDAKDGQPSLLKGLQYFCGTDECSRYAAFLGDQLDPSHSPCRNLYDHVCSRWQNEHEEIASQETLTGSYSVDDAMVDDFRDKLVRLLLSDDFPYPAVRRFFLSCVRANLTSRAELEALMAFVRPHGTLSMDAVTTAIVEMARIGVSPFFSVLVTKVSEATFRVELSAPTLVRDIEATEKDVAVNSKLASNSKSKLAYNFSALTNFSDADSSSVRFLAMLERKLCSKVSEAVGGKVNNCSLSGGSRISPPWNHKWYSTTGISRLAREANTQLHAAWLRLGDYHVHEGSSSREIKSVNACLSLIGRHDPYFLSYLVETRVFPATVVKNVKYKLLALQNMMSQKLGRFDISLSLGAPRAFHNSATLVQYHSDLYGGPSDVPSLHRLLMNSTWKRWVGDLDAPRNAFSASAYRSKAFGNSIVVPLTLFNATALSDPWLTYLSLARSVTRILRTVFSTEDLIRRLNQSRLAKCVPSPSSLRQPPRSPVPVKEIASRESGGDLADLAALYGSLHFYRHYVGSGQAVPGTDMSSDLLFILYYVYSLCDALALGVRDQRASLDLLRDKVRTVAKSFASLLFPACGAEDLEACDVENENLFLLKQSS